MSHYAFLPISVEKAILTLLEDIGTPRSLTVEILSRYGEWDQLSTLETNPLHYLDSESFWRDTSATSLLKKLDCLPTTFDKKAVAEQAFLDCEKMCLRTNQRLFSINANPSGLSCSESVQSYFWTARKIVAEILGPCPSEDGFLEDRYDRLGRSPQMEGRFGPGSTFADKGQASTVPDKMSSEPTFTREALAFLPIWGKTAWGRSLGSSRRSIQLVRGNRFLTVPKDSTKFRGIAVEPSVNVFYQLAFGRVIRQRLNRVGINLSEGQDKHRDLARCASTEGHLCTLDLKNASDTVCRNLVELLLPPRWFSVLDSLRSKRTLFKGHWHELSKFSSMGNGFTFELETLVFLALIAAITGRDSIGRSVFVFGDDIICPTESSKDVISALKFCGLTVNERKSFVEGPFRESCGGDFFEGMDVRPFFLKESPNEPHQLIALANGLRRAACRSVSRDHYVHRAWLQVLGGIPSRIRRLRGPEDLGDLVIHDEESRWPTRWRSGIRYVSVYRPANFRKVSWSNFRPDIVLASAILGLSSGSERSSISSSSGSRIPWRQSGVTPRDAVLGYKIGWVAFS